MRPWRNAALPAVNGGEPIAGSARSAASPCSHRHKDSHAERGSRRHRAGEHPHVIDAVVEPPAIDHELLHPQRPALAQANHGGPGQHDPAEIWERTQVVVAGEATQPIERRVHAQLASLREHTLGLLDDDPAVQRGLQLLGENLTTCSDWSY